MDFIWITNNYRVNIESIFSLERQQIINPELKKWTEKYEYLLGEYKNSLPPLSDDKGKIHLVDNDSSDEDIQEYSNLVKQNIYDEIGDKPNDYIYQYVIILSTGIKLIISSDKFEEINKNIDINQNKNKND